MQHKIAVIGLGYVGLPLAVEFAKKYVTVGFDINTARITELRSGKDSTLEIEDDVLKTVLSSSLDFDNNGLFVSDSLQDIAQCNTYIVTVPTPTDKNNRPVLTPLYKASESVGKVLKKGDYIIYESTVYPGVTESCPRCLLRDRFEKYENGFVNDGESKFKFVKEDVRITMLSMDGEEINGFTVEFIS